MIGYVRGLLEEIEENAVVLDVGGMGIRIYVSGDFLCQLPPQGTEMKIYTYTNVKEDSFTLYGFRNKDELDLFKKLISVSGIGPKGGLAILSVLSADDLRFAIYSGDVKSIAKAPGIGKKTAERVVLELKDKVSLEDNGADTLISQIGQAPDGAMSEFAGKRKDAIEALAALGYSSTDAARAVKQMNPTEDMSVEDILKASLRYLL